MPLWPPLARQHPRLRRSPRLPRDRTPNPVEQPAIRSFAPAPTPKLRPKTTTSTGSDQLHQHSHRRQIPIAPAALSVPNTPRFRALALFGRRLPERGDGFATPAAENLHNKGLMHRTRPCAVVPDASGDFLTPSPPSDAWNRRVRAPRPCGGWGASTICPAGPPLMRCSSQSPAAQGLCQPTPRLNLRLCRQ
jgi:hypothetical protein